MKKVKLKNFTSSRKKTFIITILISVLLSFALTTFYTKNLTRYLPIYLKNRVKKENTLLLKNAFSVLNKEDIPIDSIITIIKNSRQEITEVDFNMKNGYKILSSITTGLNTQMNDYNFLGYRLDIPVGLFSTNPIFMNISPKVPIKVEIQDVAMGNIKTTAKPFGINNALIEVYLNINIHSSVVYPFETLSLDSEYSSLIASKIITGQVPSFFGGTINSKSDTIDLPLN